MIKWAGRLILLIGVGHTIIALALTAPTHAEAWFTTGVWNEPLTDMSQANGAYWFSLGSFGPLQIVLGLLILWMDRRGIVPPTFIAWIFAANAVICGVIFGPSPWPVDLVSAGLLIAGAHRARRANRTPAAPAPSAP
ncbi:DUF6463 family protein [Phytomonospora endophytica]|uniref:Uncharacterized protein n=1 Tax=Phytomonospora endophytica TaxID=714109 RepID=A0A841F9U9_9ACTN|nr:DUF6463 family protein [Phytomonospora endophytica]MBB6033026.1 hypothetical protein [Phytomonospora endophytica]GIG65252.1 hypothetical protein Pen01_15470 [Phytomonospora endophytica]